MQLGWASSEDGVGGGVGVGGALWRDDSYSKLHIWKYRTWMLSGKHCLLLKFSELLLRNHLKINAKKPNGRN